MESVKEDSPPLCPLCGCGCLLPTRPFGGIPFYECLIAGTAYVVTAGTDGDLFLTLFDPGTATVLFDETAIARYSGSERPICLGITEGQLKRVQRSGSGNLCYRIRVLLDAGCCVFVYDWLGTPSARLLASGSHFGIISSLVKK